MKPGIALYSLKPMARKRGGSYHVAMSFHREHLPEPLPTEPLTVVAAWLQQAIDAGIQPNPNAMVLATADAHGAPSARVVLCKGIEARDGYITFFTNYLSRKGMDLSSNPRAAIVMHWDTMRRQVRMEGSITRTTAAESDAYFSGRAWQSRIGAWASQQSSPIASRSNLLRAAEHTAQRFGAPSPISSDDTSADPGVAIARPSHWGGYHLWVQACELWVEGSARLHDRARWTRTLTPHQGAYQGGTWRAERLQP
jgi:pyridoxamine 5'-phosphate oxidase